MDNTDLKELFAVCERNIHPQPDKPYSDWAKLERAKVNLQSLEARVREVRDQVALLYCASGCSCCRDDEGWEVASEKLGQLLDIPECGDGGGRDFYTVRDKALTQQGQPPC